MRVLVINLMYIGDLLFATPVLRGLKHAFPSAEIEMLIDRPYLDVVVNNPHLHRVLPIDKKGYHNRPLNYLRLIRSIRRSHYDLVINLHPNERSSAIAAFSGGKKRCGFAAKGFGPFFDPLIRRRSGGHQVEVYLNVLKALGVTRIEHCGLEMPLDEAAQSRADRIWREAGLAGDSIAVGLNPGGSWPTKRWTLAGYARLVEMLYEGGFVPVLFGGPTDLQMADELLSLTARRPIVLTGRLTLLELAAAVGRCAVFVSGDTGPMHIAASQRVPVVAIFGPSDPIRYGPYGVRHRIVSADEPCLPCGLHYCQHHRCMTAIAAGEVYQAICQMVQASEAVQSASFGGLTVRERVLSRHSSPIST